jgi:hypothetical protein
MRSFFVPWRLNCDASTLSSLRFQSPQETRIIPCKSKLFSSSSPSPDAINNDDPNPKHSAILLKEKRSLANAYQTASSVFGLIGALLLVMPDRTMNTMVAAKFGGAAGYGMASGLCHILKGATEHDRLSSDTYKRLNIGLLGFCLLQLPAIPGEAGFLPTFLPALSLSIFTTLVRIIGASLAFRGWKRGLGPGKITLKVLCKDISRGTLETVKGLRVKAKQKSMTYRNFLLLVMLSLFSSLMEGIFYFRYMKDLVIGAFEISLQWSAVARLFLISTMIYSLKDSAERDRLRGTTFVQLNAMIGLWALLVAVGQCIYPLGFASYRGAFMFVFSGPFLIKAYVNSKAYPGREKKQA